MRDEGDRDAEGVDDEGRYFRAIEDLFVRLRGAPLLLSPSDWRTAEGWRQRGIPLSLVQRTLQKVFSERRARGARGRIQSLRYCAPAVETAWEEARELAGPGRRPEPPPVDVAARLGRLAAALPDLPDRDELATTILRLTGSSEEVEAALGRLDRETIERLSGALSAGDRHRLEAALEASLAPLSGRLSADEVAAARRRLLRQAVRRHWGLPVLSLFALAASREDPPEEP